MQRFTFQTSIVVLLSALLAAPSVIAAPPAQAAPLALLSNDIAIVESSSFSQSLALTGTLQPWQQTQLSAEIEAAVEDVYVRPGEAVKKGQVLLRFDLRDVKARLAAQQAQLDATKAQLDLARKNLTRNKDLLQQNFISQNTFESTENQLQVNEASYRAQAAQVEIARKALSVGEVRAPFAGMVAERSVNPGQRVGLNAKLLSLVDLSELELEANVPLAQAAAVKEGQMVTFTVEGYGARRFDGKVVRVNPVAQTGSRMLTLYARIPNPANELKGGMFVQGQLWLAQPQQALVLPLSAMRKDDSGDYVLVAKNGRVERRNIKLGNVDQGSRRVAVSSGVVAGEAVLLAKLRDIKPGVAVKLPAR
jgi:RND family efflux transporter MFP subunit